MAARDAEAARGLAAAYSSLTRAARREIVDALAADCRVHGLSCSGVLASLLAVEQDRGVALRMAHLMQAEADPDLAPAKPPWALGAREGSRSALLLLRPLHACFVEASGLGWHLSRGITHTLFEPLIETTCVAGLLRRLPWHLHFDTLDYRAALDTAAQAIWRHRRLHGSLPRGIDHFSKLF